MLSKDVAKGSDATPTVPSVDVPALTYDLLKESHHNLEGKAYFSNIINFSAFWHTNKIAFACLFGDLVPLICAKESIT